ncbi:MAG TPA: CPBP family intramembrane metalloprotease [Verrucomicrobiota bacterium]|nr:CPBP family intramembrane metalloprotease [Verrucomicrobiota bacterium]HNU50919.1 CPBP family intramembrane metalloprotease [Verrucomicrobiota bacterium]
MAPPHTWKPEPLARLLFQLLLGLAVVGLATQLIARGLGTAADEEPHAMIAIAGTLAFQVYGFVIIHLFLRNHDLTWTAAFGLANGSWSGVALHAALVLVVVFPANVSLMWLSQKLLAWQSIEPVIQPTVEALQQASTPQEQILLGFMAIVMAPAIEEVLFRGIFYTAFAQRGWPKTGLWFTSIVFAVTHANLMTFLPLLFFAVVLTRQYEYSGNLLGPVCTHSLFNATNYLWLILAAHG